MSTRRPASREKRKSPRVQKDKAAPQSVADQSESGSLPEETFQDIDFIDFFGDGSEPLTVELYRDRPKYVGEIAVNGFCETLPQGADLQYIKDAYGGGRFRVMQRNVTGKVTKQRYFDIAGSAVVPAAEKVSEPEPDSPKPRSDEESPALETVTQIEGIPVTGVLAKDIEIIKSVMLLKAALHENSPDDRMISLLLERQKPPDVLGVLKDIAPLIGTVKELVGEFTQQEAASGSNFIDLAREALKAFGQYAKHTPRAKPVALPAAPLGSPPAQIREVPTVAPLATDETLEPVPENKLEESEPLMSPTPLAIMDSAVQTIVQSFNLGTDAAQVVGFLNSRVPFNVEQRREFLTVERKAELFIAAELILDEAVEGYAEDAEKRARFATYFVTIFDGFLESE